MLLMLLLAKSLQSHSLPNSGLLCQSIAHDKGIVAARVNKPRQMQATWAKSMTGQPTPRLMQLTSEAVVAAWRKTVGALVPAMPSSWLEPELCNGFNVSQEYRTNKHIYI